MQRRRALFATGVAFLAPTALAFGADAVTAAPRATADGTGYTTNGYTNLGSFPEPQVCHGVDPACYHDWGNFDPATTGYRLLVYTTRQDRGTRTSGRSSDRGSIRR
ncbi:MAG: hypothetical protein JO345_36675 [Streptosporangiaceae bacterium]|nr:hypothetical protein [Streptosporangiaceae bacterium]